MESGNFDKLTRDLGETSNRRNAVRAILAAVGGAILGWLPGASPAAAANDCCPIDLPFRCGCTRVNRNSDVKNCGTCGKICAVPTNTCKQRTCVNGQCRSANKPNGTACSGTNSC